MAAATVVAQLKGMPFALRHVYGSWWFSLLWAVGVAVGAAYFICQRVRRAFVVLLHVSFVVILAGAFITHVSGRKGIVHLRKGTPVTAYTDENNRQRALPFTLKLDRFAMDMHHGNAAAMDYASYITILHADGETEKAKVSMNNIYNRQGVRLYQSSFDDDLLGSYLQVNSDPFGIPVTYTGYALLFVGLLWMLADRRGRFRKLLRSTALSKPLAVLLVLLATAEGVRAQTVLPQETAEKFGKLFVVYNGRICPMETFAIDFTKKIHGKARYKHFSPCQILSGFYFFPHEWMAEPLLKVKGKELRKRLNLPEYISAERLFGTEGYLPGPYLEEAQRATARTGFHKEVLDLDDKMMLLMRVSRGEAFQMFPYPMPKGGVTWTTPADNPPQGMPKEQLIYIRTILPMAAEAAGRQDYKMVNEILDKLLRYQHRYGAPSLPAPIRVWAEGVYNRVPFPTVLFMVNLTLGFLSVLTLKRRHWQGAVRVVMGAGWLALSASMALRWLASGSVPIGNGYETMIFLAWLVLLITLPGSFRIPVLASFGLLMSGFMLLVSHISSMDPAITPRMPVLNSPLLSIHVSVIMMSYALLSLTFVAAVAFFIACGTRGERAVAMKRQTTIVSQIFLYPAITTMGLGIFIGAVWANISWGSYWSWDPKETWALITFMVYAVPLHLKSVPALRKPAAYHLYMVGAFLVLLMTYLGVNYLLSGMHSYA